MADNDRNTPPLKPHGDKLEQQVKDLPEKNEKQQQKDEQVKGGAMKREFP